MSARTNSGSPPRFLAGSEGELVLIRIATEPRCLEELLDCLAGLPFPVNPQLYHGVPTVVEFPAYAGKLASVSEALSLYGFDPATMRVDPMIQAITAA